MRRRVPAAHAAKQPRPGILNASPDQLAALAPLAGLSRERLAELSEVAAIERAPRGADPFSGRTLAKQSVFLLAGELLLYFQAGGTLVVVGGSE